MSPTLVTMLMHEVIGRRAHRTSRRALASLARQQGVIAAMTQGAQQILENGSYREPELCSKPFAERALFAPRASNPLTCSGVTITVVVRS